MGLNLSYDDAQLALQASIDGFCTRSGTGPLFAAQDPLPGGFWSGLAELGVLGLGTRAGGGGPLEIAAAMETLGAHGAPGPLVGTFIATSILADNDLDAVVNGEAIVSVGSDGLFPWAPVADLFVAVDGGDVWRAEPSGPIVELDTTGNEPWGRLDDRRIEAIDDVGQALQRGDLAIAAYVVGAAQQLIDLAAAYARDRIQFNKPIATFQAVSHPLAAASTRVNASRILTRGAAQKLHVEASDGAPAAATARLSAVDAATAAAYQAHQLFGAIGFTREGPIGHLSHRIRQVGLLPPNQARARDLVLQTVL